MTQTKKAVQYLTSEYLEECSKLTHEQILEFLENYRQVVGGVETQRKLISLRVPENLLDAFKAHASLRGERYQTRLIQLIREDLAAPAPVSKPSLRRGK